MVDFSQFEYISFDCYGTLIDWESGILGYLRPLLHRKNLQVTDDEILNLYSEFEPRNQQIYKPYREILAAVVRDFASHFNFEASGGEAAATRRIDPQLAAFLGHCAGATTIEESV